MSATNKPKIDRSRPPIDYIFAKDITYRCVVADIDIYTAEQLKQMESFHGVGEDPTEAMSTPRTRYININTMVEVFRNGGMPLFMYEDFDRVYEIHVRIFDYLAHMQNRMAVKNTRLPVEDLRLMNDFDRKLCESIPDYLVNENLEIPMLGNDEFGTTFMDEMQLQEVGVVVENKDQSARIDFGATFGEFDWMKQ